MHDGFSELPTIDQHPFFFFLLQGILLRLADSSEFVLRFPSVMAATLLIPILWAFAHYFVRRRHCRHQPRSGLRSWPRSILSFSGMGQEARPYALWALLALVSTYLLLRCTESLPVSLPVSSTVRPRAFVGYGLTVAMFLSTHYFAVFLMPLTRIYPLSVVGGA